MAISKCEFCGKAFNSFGTKICAECLKQVDEAYIKARKYIYQNPDKANFTSITENTDISEKELNYLMKQGRINIDHRAEAENRCKLCGAEVASGFLCDHCKLKVVTERLKPEIEKTDKAKKENKERKGRELIYMRGSKS